jgi:hypothetical protein
MGLRKTFLDIPPGAGQGAVGVEGACIHKEPIGCSTGRNLCCACCNGNPLSPIIRVVKPGEAMLPAWLPHDNPNLYCPTCRIYWDSHFHVTRLPTFESTIDRHVSTPSPYVCISFTAVEGVPNARERFSPPLGSRPAGHWTLEPRIEAPAMVGEFTQWFICAATWGQHDQADSLKRAYHKRDKHM